MEDDANFLGSSYTIHLSRSMGNILPDEARFLVMNQTTTSSTPSPASQSSLRGKGGVGGTDREGGEGGEGAQHFEWVSHARKKSGMPSSAPFLI